MLTFFLSVAFANDFVQLHASSAEASSFLKSSWNRYNENYHPNYILDGNPKTAWVEGVEGNGEGEKIIIPISTISDLNKMKLRIRNGYQKSNSLLKANAAPKEILIEVQNRSGLTVATHKATLSKTMGWQEVNIASENNNSAQKLSITILSSHPGTKYKDNCISDIEIFVDSETPYNQQVEEAKYADLHVWTKDRIQTAKYFASKPKQYPFATTNVSNHNHEKITDSTVHDELRTKTIAQHQLLKQFQAQNSWYVRESSNTLEHFPDGLYLSLADDIWDLSSLSLFETDEEYATYQTLQDNYDEEDWQPPSELFLSNFKVQRNATGSVEILYYKRHFLEQGRGIYGDDSEFLCHYDSDGRLTYIYQAYVDLDSEWQWMLGEGGSTITHKHYTFDYDQNNRITDIIIRSQSTQIYVNDDYNYRKKEVDNDYVSILSYENEEQKKQLMGKKQTFEEFRKTHYSFVSAVTAK